MRLLILIGLLLSLVGCASLDEIYMQNKCLLKRDKKTYCNHIK